MGKNKENKQTIRAEVPPRLCRRILENLLLSISSEKTCSCRYRQRIMCRSYQWRCLSLFHFQDTLSRFSLTRTDQLQKLGWCFSRYFQRCVSYRNQSFDFHSKSNDWFLYEMQRWTEMD